MILCCVTESYYYNGIYYQIDESNYVQVSVVTFEVSQRSIAKMRCLYLPRRGIYNLDSFLFGLCSIRVFDRPNKLSPDCFTELFSTVVCYRYRDSDSSANNDLCPALDIEPEVETVVVQLDHTLVKCV